MTNRITNYLPESPTTGHPMLKAERRLRREVESMLRDMAFVMKMTQRVKAQILADNETRDSLAV
jgi:hypothetical protein